MMANFERTCIGAGLNIELHRSVLPYRTIEAIKGMRRQVKYRRLLEEGTSSSVHHRLSLPPPAVGVRVGKRPNSSTPPESSSGTTDASTIKLSGTRRLAQGAQPPELASRYERCLEELRIELVRLSAALGIELPHTIEDLQTNFDLWSRVRPARSQTTTGAARPPLPKPPGRPSAPGQRGHERRLLYARFQWAHAKDRGRSVIPSYPATAPDWVSGISRRE